MRNLPTPRHSVVRSLPAGLLALLLTALPLAAAAADPSNAPANAPATAPAAAPAPAAAGALTPEKVVEAYLKAMQEQRFGDAYAFVSKTLRAGKDKEQWSKEQQYIIQMGEVKILDFKVHPAQIGKDGVARVPNLLKSQDKFLNQLGLDEHEVYELVQEDGAWRIDQQTLAEGADRDKYFPGESGSK